VVGIKENTTGNLRMRVRIALTALLCLCGYAVFAQTPAPAHELFESAKVQVQQQHKLIFLVFGASWCGPCHRLDAFLAASEPRRILDKYFVEAKIDVLEQKGKHPELGRIPVARILA
jgi:thiol-disulfide isomerase/thioredoxin